MRFNKACTDLSVTFAKIEITSLAYRAVEFFSLLGRCAIALNLAVIGVFARFRDGQIGVYSK